MFLQLNELQLKKYDDHYVKLKLIFERTIELIDTFHPDEIAIEAPFFGKNVQKPPLLGPWVGEISPLCQNRYKALGFPKQSSCVWPISGVISMYSCPGV